MNVLATRLRLSHHYLAVLDRFNERYLKGGDDVLIALKELEVEWGQIQFCQVEASRFTSDEPEFAKLCIYFSLKCPSILTWWQPTVERLRWCLDALHASRSLDDRKGESHVLMEIGTIRLRLGELSPAVTALEEALVIATQLGEADLKEMILSRIGTSKAASGTVEEGIDILKETRKTSRKRGDRQAESDALQRLGDIYFREAEYLEAVVSWNARLEIAESLGDVRGRAQALFDLGRVAQALNRPALSAGYYLSAIPLVEAVRDDFLHINIMKCSGKIFLAFQEYALSIECFKIAREKLSKNGNRPEEAETLLDLCEAYRLKGEPREALILADQAAYLSSLLDDLRLKARALECLGRIMSDLSLNKHRTGHQSQHFGQWKNCILDAIDFSERSLELYYLLKNQRKQSELAAFTEYCREQESRLTHQWIIRWFFKSNFYVFWLLLFYPFLMKRHLGLWRTLLGDVHWGESPAQFAPYCWLLAFIVPLRWTENRRSRKAATRLAKSLGIEHLR